MRSSELNPHVRRAHHAAERHPGTILLATVASLIALLWATHAEAQPPPQGFAVERFYPSAPGAGWLVMDDLELRGGLGGALAATTGYSHNPLLLTSAAGERRLRLVEHQAFLDFGGAVTWDRFRLYANMSSPLIVSGDSGTIDEYRFEPGRNPDIRQDCGQRRVCVDPGWNPDTISDPRFGFDVRLYGGANATLRIGLGTQLVVPAGHRAEYLTDGTWRAMERVLLAGDVAGFAYAAQLGVHLRRLDDTPVPGSPRGSELLYGLAFGARVPANRAGTTALVLGPELFGATALRSPFGSNTTALEGLLSGRVEGRRHDGAQVRLKVGAGAGFVPEFGAPEYRVVLSIETFDRGNGRRR